jgi:hypothetical protein
MNRIIGVFSVILLLLLGCASNTVKQEGEKSDLTREENQVNSLCELVLDLDFINFAKKGRLKGLEIDLFSKQEQVEDIYGEPITTGFDNAKYLQYGDCFFYIWNEGEIGVIDIKNNYSVTEVKNILGNPDYEGNPDAGFDEYVLGYKAGEYYLYFKYSKPDSKYGLLRFKKP